MNNGKVIRSNDEHCNPLFFAESLHMGEVVKFHSLGAATHWLWLRDELFGSLAQRGALPDWYVGPAR